MKRLLTLILLVPCCAMAQAPGNVFFAAPVAAETITLGMASGPGPIVKGAPYSATITNESVQTLADGNRIVHSSTGSTARDSQGRTRQDTPLPSIGGLAPEDAPHFVFVQDPVAGFSYSLNLTEKTAWKNPLPPASPIVPMPPGAPVNAMETQTIIVHAEAGSAPVATAKHVAEAESSMAIAPIAPLPPPDPAAMGTQLMVHKRLAEADASAEVTTDNLGAQVIEGVQANGVRTTRTIPAGKIGNDRPIVITTEVWTSPELQTIVLSKRNDPRTGEQTFKLTNIQRSEPDPALFTVPADFKLTERGANTVIYRSKQ